MTHTVLGSDTDEFAGYDFSEFTEEDFAQIDADIARNHLPKVSVAYETSNAKVSSPSPVVSDKRCRTRDSPLDLFRSYGVLSVTDLVSPSWCEIQFEYGLRGKRSRPLYHRPKSFRSASGKEIKTNTTIAAKNSVVTSKGTAIHKSLEREVKAEETVVEITTTEERWALRLVNMLSCLRGLQHEGITREMPVFGIEDGEIVVGIIDELVYQPKHVESNGLQLAGSSQTCIENHFTVSEGPFPSNGTDSYALQIIDTKTRRKPSLPSHEDTLPSRLQLMLYHRLLSRLVSPEPSFDFMTFWQLANVDPNRQLSWDFLQQAGLIADKGELQVLNLADLSALWHDLVYQLRIAGVDEQLKLVYRLQLYGQGGEMPSTTHLTSGLEDPSKQTEAISLGERSIINGDVASSLPPSQQRNNTSSTGEGKGGEVQQTLGEAGSSRKKQYQILGTKVFKYDSEFLSAYLADVLTWWRGERRPKGVPVEFAQRCATCEYCDDCEWREERAKEFREQVERKGGDSCLTSSLGAPWFHNSVV